MADASVLVKQAADGDRPIDNETVTTDAGVVYRQRVQAHLPAGQSIGVDNLPADFPDAAVLAALLATLDVTDATAEAKLEAIRLLVAGTLTVGGTVALDAPTLAALEHVTAAIEAGQVIGLDASTLAALENIVVSGTVALDASTLAALETINAVCSGSVELGATTLAALESITVTVSGAVVVGGTVAVSNFPATQPVSGTVAVSGTVPVSGPLTDAQLRATPVPVSGTVTSAAPTSGTGAVSTVAASVTSVEVLPANGTRRAAALFNDSASALYLKLAASAASSSSFTIVMQAGSYFEFPTPIYTGSVRGIWTSATGQAVVTEWT